MWLSQVSEAPGMTLKLAKLELKKRSRHSFEISNMILMDDIHSGIPIIVA